jgi:hypothetical protein
MAAARVGYHGAALVAVSRRPASEWGNLQYRERQTHRRYHRIGGVEALQARYH